MSDRAWARGPVVQLTLARLREYLREPEALFWVFVFPLLLTLALGVAFRAQGQVTVHVGVLEGVEGDEVTRAIAAAVGFDVRRLGADRLEAALRDGEVDVVVLPGVPPTYRFDPMRPESRLGRLAVDDALQRAAGRSDRWRAAEQPVVSPGSRYIDWLVPGLLGMNIMSTSLWSLGFSIVQMRMRKLLKRLAATPMRRPDFLAAQIAGRLLFLVPETASLLVFAWLVFGVSIRGSLLLIAILSMLGALSFAGIALLVASRVRTVEAVSGLLNVVMLPMWLLSGVFFSTTHFPSAMQPVVKALPLTALNDALRAVILEGTGPAGVALEAIILAGWGVGSSLVALRLFRWT